MIRLSARSLHALPPKVARPRYSRDGLTTGIVHLGAGAFHRAHQAVATDDCLNAGTRDWAITAVSLRSADVHAALAPQDGLYTLAVTDGVAQELRVVGAIARTLVAPEAPSALLAAMADPRVRIVSLTVTEKGYCADPATGDLNLDHPDIRHDIAHPDAPHSALGVLLQALARRRADGVAPFTPLSCDNLPGNGALLRRVLMQLAATRDADLARHVAELACPSTMVDRIVPATTDADRTRISVHLGQTDAWPVCSEPFFQWVIEDDFPSGRPDWAIAGAEFTTDVAPYEAMKLRLLNGAHSAIAAMGRVAGFQTVAEAMADPVIRAYIKALWAEVAPTLAPGIDARPYTDRLLRRFDNTALHHRLAQIATDASLKLPQRILAPMRALAPSPTPMLSFALAAVLRSCEGQDEAGAALPLSDPPVQHWSDRPGREVPAADAVRAWAGFAPLFGAQPMPDMAGVAAALQDIRSLGVLQAARMRLG